MTNKLFYKEIVGAGYDPAIESRQDFTIYLGWKELKCLESAIRKDISGIRLKVGSASNCKTKKLFYVCRICFPVIVNTYEIFKLGIAYNTAMFELFPND